MAHKFWDDETIRESSDEDEEDDDEMDETDEENRKTRYKAYLKYLPAIKEYAEHEKPNLFTDKDDKQCAICLTQWFKGWKALMAHAMTYRKKKVQQHRGYHDALKEALRVDEPPQGDSSATEMRAVSVNPQTNLIVWPPVMVFRTFDIAPTSLFDRVVLLLKTEEFKEFHGVECLPSTTTCMLARFQAEAIGYAEAQMLGKWFLDRKQGREEFMRAQNRGLKPKDDCFQPLIFGYLASVDDMHQVDHKKQIVNWSIENQYEKVQGAQKKFKQEHDNEQAEIKAIALQLENLAENEIELRTNKEHIEELIKKKQQEVENHKQRAQEMEKNFSFKMRAMETAFGKDMERTEALCIARERRKKQELEKFENRLKEEQNLRKKEIENLQKQFHMVAQDLRHKETQKALQQELEVMAKHKKFMEDMANAEAMFNNQAREQESRLQEKQHRERMQLLEEAKREREQLLKEWLEKQETLKKAGNGAQYAREQLEKEAQEQASECAVCWDLLTEDTRALLSCGHATICIDCAKDVFKQKKGCPLCRQEIKKEPIIFPKKLFM